MPIDPCGRTSQGSASRRPSLRPLLHLDVVDAALRTIAPKDLFFLDSTNLHSVQDLEALVNRSANYLLFLTAEVLQRPAVLV